MNQASTINRTPDLNAHNQKIKYTTELSDTISINKRLGIEHLLPQKDVKKPAAQKKLDEEREARKLFQEMVSAHKNKGNTTIKSSNKSYMNASVADKSISKTYVQSKAAPVVTQKPAKANSKSNTVLYNRLATEIDEIIADISNETPDAPQLKLDHLRVILVKTGFIGNNIKEITEIQKDEAMLDKIWKIINNEQELVTSGNVKTICGIIMGLRAPIFKRTAAANTDESAVSQSNSTVHESFLKGQIGVFTDEGAFKLRSQQEKTKVMRLFTRLMQNRQKFLHDGIKQKQLAKIQPTETFMPQINSRSDKIERKKNSGQKVPRYQVLLEKGNMYKIDREQKALMALEGDVLLDENHIDLDVQHQISQEEIDQKQNFREAIRQIQAENYLKEAEDDQEQVLGDVPDSRNDSEIVKHQSSDIEPIDLAPAQNNMSDSRITPLKDNFGEVKEEDVEESPVPHLHTSGGEADLHTPYNDGIKGGVDTDPIIEDDQVTPDNQYSDRIHQEYQNEVLETNEKEAEGEGEYDSEGEYDQEDAEDEPENQNEDISQKQIPLLFVDVNLGEGNHIYSFDFVLNCL